jgi:hypothetical protein
MYRMISKKGGAEKKATNEIVELGIKFKITAKVWKLQERILK